MKREGFSAFKKSYDHPREFAVDEDDWNVLNERLTIGQDRRRGALFVPWWALAAGMFLILLSGVLWTGLQDAKILNHQLADRVDSLMQPTIVESTSRDTVWITNTIYIDQEEYKAKYISSYFSTPYHVSHSRSPLFGASVFNPPFSTTARERTSLPSGTILDRVRRSVEKKPQEVVPPVPALSASLVIPSFLQDSIQLFLPLYTSTVRTHRYPFRPLSGLQPLGVHVGIEGGVGLLPNSLDEQGYQEGGVVAAALLGKRLGIQARLQWAHLRYQLDDFDEMLGAAEVPSPTPDLRFAGAEVLQPTMDYSVGLQYRFRSKGAWHPILGFAYGRRQLESYQVFYNFKNESTDVELEVDYPGRERALVFWEGNLGFQRSIGRKWQLGVSANFRKAIPKGGRGVPATLGISAQVAYRVR